jgi:hypothetical protein
MSTHWNQNNLQPLEPEARRSRPSNRKWWRRKWVPYAALGASMLFIGVAIGASGQPDPVEVVKTVPGPTKTVTKEVEVTPAACLKALDLSEQGFTLSAEAMGYMSDALTAASQFDTAAIQQANSDLTELNPKIKALTAPMKSAATECRAAAK